MACLRPWTSSIFLLPLLIQTCGSDLLDLNGKTTSGHGYGLHTAAVDNNPSTSFIIFRDSPRELAWLQVELGESVCVQGMHITYQKGPLPCNFYVGTTLCFNNQDDAEELSAIVGPIQKQCGTVICGTFVRIECPADHNLLLYEIDLETGNQATTKPTTTRKPTTTISTTTTRPTTISTTTTKPPTTISTTTTKPPTTISTTTTKPPTTISTTTTKPPTTISTTTTKPTTISTTTTKPPTTISTTTTKPPTTISTTTTKPTTISTTTTKPTTVLTTTTKPSTEPTTTVTTKPITTMSTTITQPATTISTEPTTSATNSSGLHEEQPFYYNQAVPLSYANCAEVEAVEASVLQGIPYDFFCNCGQLQDPKCKEYQSCSKLLAAGFEDTGYYEIDPDGPDNGVRGFLVFCDLCTRITTAPPTTVEPPCQNELGLEDRTIPDSSMTASTEMLDPNDGVQYYSAHKGRLNFGSFWAPTDADRSTSWIQVAFDKSMRVSGIITQGSAWWNFWVKTLNVEYKKGGGDLFQTISETFNANTDASTPKTIMFPEKIEADVVRVKPLTWNSGVGMRLEILGCEIVTPSTESPPPPPTCRGTTVIDHEQTRSSDLLEVKNKPGEIVIPITYKPSIEQISALLASSDTCQQYIQYDCQNSNIWDASGWPNVWWKSRHGKDMFNFGGVPTGSEGCECSRIDVDNCITSVPLGVEDGRIADSEITASTELDQNHKAIQARLNHVQPTTTGSDSWVPKLDDSSPWIRADLLVPTWISGVLMQGRGDSNEWVKTYAVQYTSDGTSWEYVTDDANENMIFTGNTDRSTIVTSMFPSRVLATAVRIHPLSWERLSSMRFELLGCRPGCTRPSKKCNCDGVNNIWDKDAGLLTDRGQLPVTTLRFGGNDKSKYILGPLECKGSRILPKRSCAELWSDGVRTDMEYGIDPDGPDGLGPPFTVFCNLSNAAPILRSCEELWLVGYKTNGYYDIDPDGPNIGEAPFTVFCDIDGTSGGRYTIIHHDTESKGRVKGYKDAGEFELSPNYMVSSTEQMYNLIGASKSCKQFIKYDCYNSKMFKTNNVQGAEAWWTTGENAKMINWGAVTTNVGCSCSSDNSCSSPSVACNCDVDNDNTWKEDSGWLTDKDTLPVMKVYLAHTETSSKSGYHTLGPLHCSGKTDTYPLYRTCAELVCAGYDRNGYYLLDSDGWNTGDDPYVAYCDMDNNGITILSHDQPTSINMKDSTDVAIPVNYSTSINQLKMLTSLSASCRQHLKFSCKKFPIWNAGGLKVWWDSAGGLPMNSWGGVATEDIGCACAANSGCNTASFICHCNTDDLTERVDKGWITDKLVLPVTALNAEANGNAESIGIVMLGALECEGTDLPSPLRTCDEYMNAGFGSGWYQIDPDGPEGSVTSFSAYCDQGVTVIHHDSQERRLAKSEEVNTNEPTLQRDISYRATNEQIVALMAVSKSCRQFVKYECFQSNLLESHWVSRDGEIMKNWGNVDTGVTGCECGKDNSCQDPAKACNCNSDDAVWRSDEGYLKDTNKLPVSKLMIADINDVHEYGFYTLGPLECYEKSQVVVLQSCHQLKRQGGYSRSGYYDIDPDGDGTGVEPFAVYCDMSDGTTIIGHSHEERTLLRGDRINIDIEYLASLDQIAALIDKSSQCQQYLSYECYKSALFTETAKFAFWKHGSSDEFQYNFGGIDMGLKGCQCGFDESCPGIGTWCNCEASGWRNDSGWITNKEQLPVVTMRFDDIEADQEMAFYTLGKLECSNKEFTSCSELKESGYVTDGYYTVYANGSPELRFCKMTALDNCPVYTTGPNFRYQYRFPALPDHVTSFQFTVKADSNVFIALSPQPEKRKNNDELYEIAIKSEGVNEVEIRRCVQSCKRASVPKSNILNIGGQTHFYINFANGVIQVGHVGESPILTYTDSSPLQVKYVGFTSGFDQEVEWRFHEYLCKGFRKYGIKQRCVRYTTSLLYKSVNFNLILIMQFFQIS